MIVLFLLHCIFNHLTSRPRYQWQLLVPHHAVLVIVIVYHYVIFLYFVERMRSMNEWNRTTAELWPKTTVNMVTWLSASSSSAFVNQISFKIEWFFGWDMAIYRFSRWRPSATLNFRGPRTGSLTSPCRSCYWSSIEIIALNFLFFEKIVFFAYLFEAIDRRTYKHHCVKPPQLWRVVALNIFWIAIYACSNGCRHLSLHYGGSQCLPKPLINRHHHHHSFIAWK